MARLIIKSGVKNPEDISENAEFINNTTSAGKDSVFAFVNEDGDLEFKIKTSDGKIREMTTPEMNGISKVVLSLMQEKLKQFHPAIYTHRHGEILDVKLKELPSEEKSLKIQALSVKVHKNLTDDEQAEKIKQLKEVVFKLSPEARATLQHMVNDQQIEETDKIHNKKSPKNKGRK